MPARENSRQRAALLQFARRVNALKRAWEAANPHDTFKIDGTLSRILALTTEYDSGRSRKEEPTRGPAKAPTIFTVLDLAERFKVPICALFALKNHVVFSSEEIASILSQLRSLHGTFSSTASAMVEFDEAVPFETMQKDEWDFAANQTGIEGDFAPEPHQVFRGIHGIGDERFQVIRVASDSMSPLLLPGDRVLIDTSRTSPRNDDVVAVFSTSLGRMIGYWHAAQKQYFLKKENPEQQPVLLGDPHEWQVLGTILSFVDAPLRPKDRLARTR